MRITTKTDPLTELRTTLGMSEKEVAEFLTKKTKRPCKLRTVQAWSTDPEKPSARPCPSWAMELLQEEAVKRA